MNFKIILILIFGISCLNQSDVISTDNSDNYIPPNSNTLIEADYYATQDLPYSFDLKGLLSTLDISKTYVFSLENKASWMSVDLSTGVLSGNPFQNTVHNNLRAIATNVLDVTDKIYSDYFSIGINGDPLKTEQWHLKNTGQTTFSDSSAIAGFDINEEYALLNDYLGQGVKIAVSDSGVELAHRDLSSNVLIGESRDYSLSFPYVSDPTATNAHGTAVSGIISAVGWNNIGVRGVAPKSKFAGFQFLDSNQTTSIKIHQASGNFDIFNYSYGDERFFDDSTDPDFLDQVEYMSKSARGGLGAFIVKAAGNEFIAADDYINPSICSSHNSNIPQLNESPYALVVGAINATGVKATYSSAGSNIWVTAPGGEQSDSFPKILTTDLPTCFKGFSFATSDPANAFEYGSPLNQDCDYTSTMNGTSSATPIVSGVIANILSANPNLTFRDVKHILAMTSKKIDRHNSSRTGTRHMSHAYINCPTIELNNHEYELGWQINASGVEFNNFYGFGLVNLEEALKLARDFTLDPLNALPLNPLIEENKNFNDTQFQRSSLNLAIPDEHANGVTDNMVVTSSISFVETVQIKVNVTHPHSGEIGIELTSPNGTKSIFLNINNSFLIGSDANLNVVLASHAFYGEGVNGTWSIKVIDGREQNTGTLNSWGIALFGH